MTTKHAMTSLPRTAGRIAAAGLAAATVFLGLAGTASAHVGVTPDTAAPGGGVQLTFSVPNEEDNATTTKVEIVFPADQPLAFAAVRPLPGWKVAVTKTKLAAPIKSDDGEVSEVVSTITWSGGSIAAGEYQNFDVSVGTLPAKPTTMAFKALQTYSTGKVVRWIEVAAPGAEEPAHPAPVLTVKAAAATTGAAKATTTPATVKTGASSSDSAGSDGLARGLGGAGLVAGLAGLGFALARRRTET